MVLLKQFQGMVGVMLLKPIREMVGWCHSNHFEGWCYSTIPRDGGAETLDGDRERLRVSDQKSGAPVRLQV